MRFLSLDVKNKPKNNNHSILSDGLMRRCEIEIHSPRMISENMRANQNQPIEADFVDEKSSRILCVWAVGVLS